MQNRWLFVGYMVKCCHVSSHVIQGQYLKSTHDLAWSRSNVILHHPALSPVILGQMFLSKCRFLAAHMVKCHPLSSQGILNAICKFNILQKVWCHSLSSPVILGQYECKMKMSGVITCHCLSSHGILWRFWSKLVKFYEWNKYRVILCHPSSFFGNIKAKQMVICMWHGQVLSWVIPCHQWSKKFKSTLDLAWNRSKAILRHPVSSLGKCFCQSAGFLQHKWSESSVILCHPMSSLGNHILNFMFFAAHIVQCHPVSSHIDLEAISMRNSC
jgi:hypothetical protein